MDAFLPATGLDEAAFFKENGYLVVEKALTLAEVDELRRETVSICRGERGSVRGIVPHSPDENDDEVMRQYLCIHFPHKISPVMHHYLAHPALVNVLTQVVGPNVKCMQSMLFIKAAGKPGQAWHQDEDFIPTRDRSLIGAWIALDDATVDNGCLWVLPGSHKPGILWEMQQQNDPRFDCTDESFGFPYRDEDAVPVEVPAGSIVFFNGYLLHRSLPNTRSSGYRRVLVNHYMSAESLLPWLPSSSGKRIALTDYRDIILVAGTDPYAYKGVENIAEPGVRPDKQGGCLPPEKQSADSLSFKPLLEDDDD
ncbi:MAG: phytanoyl-CoA dioxygenase family protein [Anaerolineae bacterium]|nr:phytanoyl-CoA dioxygenase family protein [Anaerolineae bacterium]